jgi:hypothetical protein
VILAIMLFNGAGFYLYYALQLQQIRSEMRAALKLLPNDKLEVFQLTAAAFREAMIEEHEIKIGGKMYDIARTTELNDLIYVYCLHDEKEDNLLALIEHIVSSPLKDKNSIPGSVMQFLSLSFLIPVWEYEMKPDASDLKQFTPYTFNSRLFISTVKSPPPRC